MLIFRKFPYVVGVGMLALLFGATSAHSQSATERGAAAASSGTSASPPTSGSAGAAAKAESKASGASDKASSASGKSADAGLSKSDQSMMRQMAQANIAEIEAGKLAQSKTRNEKVRSFAQKMIDDHTKAQGELQQLAQQKGVTLPTEPDKAHQAALKKLGELSGAAFDRSYMKQGGLNDHKQAHQLLERVEAKAADPELKAMAAKMLPSIEEHMKMAQDTQTALSGQGGSTASGASGASGASEGKSGSAK